ncbi:MAG: outer membrane lipoprotein carrier protein LolA [Rhodobacteraceae bacterium]|nr:outer membrane lipoprotein carrier protein LolA [Paracoccaceae bacterium]
MNRRDFIAFSAAFAVLPTGQALAQNASVDRINAYLTGLRTAQARFRQENADGSIIGGTFYLKKPGKMRFEYDSPSDSLVIADGRNIAIFDAKSNVSPQIYPQRRTPLSLLSMENIDVTSSVFVRRIEERGGRSFVTMFDPEKPEYGQMTMIFNTDPMLLTEWVLRERSGLETHVYLEELQVGMNFQNRVFNIGYNRIQFEREHGE